MPFRPVVIKNTLLLKIIGERWQLSKKNCLEVLLMKVNGGAIEIVSEAANWVQLDEFFRTSKSASIKESKQLCQIKSFSDIS